MHIQSSILLQSLRWYPKKKVLATSVYEYYKAIGIPHMQQFIKVYNPLTNGIKEFTFTHADDTKYVYCNNEDKSLLLYVYKKSNHPKGGKITSLPWKNEKVYSKGRKYMMPEGIPFCFEL